MRMLEVTRSVIHDAINCCSKGHVSSTSIHGKPVWQVPFYNFCRHPTNVDGKTQKFQMNVNVDFYVILKYDME